MCAEVSAEEKGVKMRSLFRQMTRWRIYHSCRHCMCGLKVAYVFSVLIHDVCNISETVCRCDSSERDVERCTWNRRPEFCNWRIHSAGHLQTSAQTIFRYKTAQFWGWMHTCSKDRAPAFNTYLLVYNGIHTFLSNIRIIEIQLLKQFECSKIEYFSF